MAIVIYNAAVVPIFAYCPKYLYIENDTQYNS